MDADDIIREHYRRDELENVVLDALRRRGIDIDRLRADDLAGLDQLHAGSVPATLHLLELLGIDANASVLDVGSGVGGPARLAASHIGCHVTGIDISPAFVELARRLTARTRLDETVSFEVGSATEMPFGDATFTHAMLIHVGMNIEAKDRVFAEVRRVLRPGGRFGLYEQMRIGDGPLAYPMPWAEDERSSFVETRERYAELLRAAGFAIDHDDNRAAAMAAAGPPPADALSPQDLFGPSFAERIGNNLAAAFAGTLAPVLMIARAE